MWLSNATSQVWPSGAALATTVAPIAPAAPGLFSTMICQPAVSSSRAWIRRATGSVEPPGGKGTTNLIGPFGQSVPCAATRLGAARVAATLPASSERRRTIGMGILVDIQVNHSPAAGQGPSPQTNAGTSRSRRPCDDRLLADDGGLERGLHAEHGDDDVAHLDHLERRQPLRRHDLRHLDDLAAVGRGLVGFAARGVDEIDDVVREIDLGAHAVHFPQADALLRARQAFDARALGHHRLGLRHGGVRLLGDQEVDIVVPLDVDDLAFLELRVVGDEVGSLELHPAQILPDDDEAAGFRIEAVYRAALEVLVAGADVKIL